MRSQLTCRRMTEPPLPSTFRLLLVFLIYLFRLIQGNRRTWHRGAHTLINSHETCFVSGLAAATQMGADYPFDDPEARRSFNYYGNILYGWSFKKAKGARRVNPQRLSTPFSVVLWLDVATERRLVRALLVWVLLALKESENLSSCCSRSIRNFIMDCVLGVRA